MPTRLASKTDELTIHGPSGQQEQLYGALRDLIRIALETRFASCPTPSASLSLAKWRYVCGEIEDDKFSMHYAAPVRAPDRRDAIGTLSLTLVAEFTPL